MADCHIVTEAIPVTRIEPSHLEERLPLLPIRGMLLRQLARGIALFPEGRSDENRIKENKNIKCPTKALGGVEAIWKEGWRRPGAGSLDLVLLRGSCTLCLGGALGKRSTGN